MPPALNDLVARALAGDPGEAALEFNGATVPWGYLTTVAQRLDALLTDAGLGPCSPIGLVPRNRPPFCAAVLSLLAARRSIVMVYGFQSPEAIGRDIAALNLPAVIADTQDWTPETKAALAKNAVAIALNHTVPAPDAVSVIAGNVHATRTGLRGPTPEPVIELLTSGTTGAPKRAPTLYETLARAVIHGSVLDAGQATGTRGDAGTVNFPMSNISGIYSYLPMAVARRFVLLQEKFDILRWADFMKRHRPKVAILPPAGIRMALDARIPRADLAGIRYISCGMTSLDAATHREFEATYGITILLSYGATEFAGAATAMTADLHAQYGQSKFGSVGRPSGDNEVRIVDPADKHILPPGEVGLIEVKVPMLGDHFITTTDLGMLDADGFLFHRGRNDGVITRGGFKIMPGTIESVLNRFPHVAASCVVGVPEPRLGQVPVAMVEMQAGCAAPDTVALERHLRANLPAPSIPVAFHFVAALPRTPSLKIDLKAVRAFCADASRSSAETAAS